MSRTTRLVTNLKDDEVFVFGSNESGRHGKGAAKLALSWGAKLGEGRGLHGQTYGIPTKDSRVKTLPLSKIRKYVDDFIEFAKTSNSTFLVTEIGCGLAGYKAKDIAPFFHKAKDLKNVSLPQKFWNELACYDTKTIRSL
jgi:hypothetical protein